MNLFRIALFFLFFLIFGGCVRFRVDNLREELFTKLKIGGTIDSVEARIANNVLVNVPFSIPIADGFIYMNDIENSTIKVFDANGKLEKALGNSNYHDAKNRLFIPTRLGVLGIVAVENEDNLYVQNRITPQEGIQLKRDENAYRMFSGSFDTSGNSFLPSFIVHLSGDGQTKSILGASGKNSEPFRYIESIHTGGNGNLFVYHRIAEEMRLSYFKDGILEGELRESSFDIFKSEENKDYSITLDLMIPNRKSNYALASFSFFSKDDKRFKFRRIYKLNYNESHVDKVIKEIQDPSEILFSVLSNGNFYIWETEGEGNSIRLQVYDTEGNHINNKRLSFPPPRGQWRETFMDSDDNLYSIRIKAGFFEIHKWN